MEDVQGLVSQFRESYGGELSVLGRSHRCRCEESSDKNICSSFVGLHREFGRGAAGVPPQFEEIRGASQQIAFHTAAASHVRLLHASHFLPLPASTRPSLSTTHISCHASILHFVRNHKLYL